MHAAASAGTRRQPLVRTPAHAARHRRQPATPARHAQPPSRLPGTHRRWSAGRATRPARARIRVAGPPPGKLALASYPVKARRPTLRPLRPTMDRAALGTRGPAKNGLRRGAQLASATPLRTGTRPGSQTALRPALRPRRAHRRARAAARPVVAWADRRPRRRCASTGRPHGRLTVGLHGRRILVRRHPYLRPDPLERGHAAGQVVPYRAGVNLDGCPRHAFLAVEIAHRQPALNHYGVALAHADGHVSGQLAPADHGHVRGVPVHPLAGDPSCQRGVHATRMVTIRDASSDPLVTGCVAT